MRKIGSREFKNRLGRYMRAVRNGQSLVTTDRGTPIAKVSPPDREEHSDDDLHARLQYLEAQGLIRLAKHPLGRFRAVRVRGKSLSRILLEGRR